MNYYVVLPFIRNDEGELIAETGIAMPSAVAAIKLAAFKSLTRAGVVAFYRTGARDRDDYGELAVLAQYGEIPKEFWTLDERNR